MKYCPSCGQEVPAEANFCTSCGLNLNNNNANDNDNDNDKLMPMSDLIPSQRNIVARADFNFSSIRILELSDDYLLLKKKTGELIAKDHIDNVTVLRFREKALFGIGKGQIVLSLKCMGKSIDVIFSEKERGNFKCLFDSLTMNKNFSNMGYFEANSFELPSLTSTSPQKNEENKNKGGCLGCLGLIVIFLIIGSLFGGSSDKKDTNAQNTSSKSAQQVPAKEAPSNSGKSPTFDKDGRLLSIGVRESKPPNEYHGYVFPTKDNLYSGVKVYHKDKPTDPNEKARHLYTILNWGNTSSILANYLYAEYVLTNEKSWTYIDEFTGFNSAEGAFLIKKDDPAYLKGEKIYKTAEADNYRRMELADLLPKQKVFGLQKDGTMRHNYTIIKRNFLPTVNVFTVGRSTVDEMEIPTVLNNHYVKK